MVCPLKALHCTSVSPPCRNILPNRLFCCWKRLIFVEGIKKERPASFYLLSALETVPEIAVRSAILFSGGISPSPSLPISSYLISILSNGFFRSEKPLLSAEYSSYTFYFNKTGSDGLPVTARLLWENSGFSVLFGYADFFFLFVMPSTVRTPPLMNRTANHRARLLVSPVCGLFAPLPVFVPTIPY